MVEEKWEGKVQRDDAREVAVYLWLLKRL